MGQQRPRPARLQQSGLIAAGNEGQRQVTMLNANTGPPPRLAAPLLPSAVDNRPALTTQLAVACLGAGVITSFAVAQGQNPFTALGITLFSALAAVMVGQVL